MANDATKGFKAFCPAAGFATRLRPLTDDNAKAEIPVAGIPSLHYTLHRLEQLGFKDIALNSHHMAEAVHKLCEAYPFSARIKISHEPEILGTGGGLVPLRSWVGTDDLLIFIPDIISDVDVAALLIEHKKSDALVTLCVCAKTPAGKTPSVWHDGKSVVHLGKELPRGQAKAYYGSGYFVISPKFFEYIPKVGFSNLTDAFNKAIAAGERLEIYTHPGYFADLGDGFSDLFNVHVDLFKNNQKLLKQIGLGKALDAFGVSLKTQGSLIHDTRVNVENIKSSGNVFVFGDCLFKKSADLSDCLIMGPQTFSDSVTINNEIVFGKHRALFHR